jgi:alpha-amylase
VGEYWSSDLNDLRFYLEKTHECMHLFDAPLQHNLHAASRDRHYDLRRIFDHTLVKDKPWLAVTLVDNHDTQPCQALERWVDWWFKPLAYALILLRQEGYPCVFYPDLYGAAYHDKGMDISLLPVHKLPEMMQARALFAYGPQRDYFDHHRTIGWTRAGDATQPDSGMAVLLTNGEATSKHMEIGVQHAGKQFVDYLGNCPGTVAVDADGWGEFRVSRESVSVWVAE